jgi:hypothetical protein
MGALAPGRDQRHPENILEEFPIGLLVTDDEGVVMQPQRQSRPDPRVCSSFRSIHGPILHQKTVMFYAPPGGTTQGPRLFALAQPPDRRLGKFG